MMEKYYKLNFSDITTRRLDPWHYQPTFVKQLNKILSQESYYTLDEVIDTNRNIAGGATPLGSNYPETGTVKFYRSGEVKETFLDYDSAVFLSNEDNEKLKRSQLIEDDIVLSITGAKFGKSAVVQKYNCPGNISQHSVRFHPNKSRIDPSFLVAYLNSPTGQIVIWKEAYGGTRPAIDYPGIRSLIIPMYNLKTQKYIGDKVRQAEQLKQHTRSIKSILDELENKIPLNKVKDDLKKQSIYVDKKYIHPNRLDPDFYSQKYLDYDSHLSVNNSFVTLGSIAEEFRYGASVPANYVESNIGIPFVRGNALSKNQVSPDKIVFLHPSYSNDLVSTRLRKNDLLITRSGTVGVIAVVTEEYEGYSFGSFIIRCRINNQDFVSNYLSWFLNSWIGQEQFRRLENGAIQQNINIEELSSIKIWKAPNNFQIKIDQLIKNYNNAINLSQKILLSSKLLVEALIEGQITEQQLIDTQNSLEAGDNSLDRDILSKITDKGFNIEGKPVFHDIDKLYDLLEESQEAFEQKDHE
ncbi:TPA: restriction endonuclease subunit S [Legionella pneumophila]